MTLGERIRSAREQLGWDREVLAGMIGVEPTSVSAWEDGVEEPRLGDVKRLAPALGVPLAWLAGIDEPGVPPQGSDAGSLLETGAEAEGHVGDDDQIAFWVDDLISEARRTGASAVHLECRGPGSDAAVRFRVDGRLVDQEALPAVYRRQALTRLKIMAGLDITERRQPQQGRIRVPISDHALDVWLLTIPTADGDEDAVLHLQPSRTLRPIDSLGMSEGVLARIEDAVESRAGLILVVGPARSGKTTTLHALLGHLNPSERKIWTIERAIDIRQHGLRQVVTQPHLGLTHAAALRAVRAADADVIMVSEIESHETAMLAVDAALGGQLVLSTLYTAATVDAIVRLLDMGLDRFRLADSLVAVLAQRVVPTICLACRDRYRPDEGERTALAEAYGAEALGRLGYADRDGWSLHRGKGCVQCHGTGYHGHTGLFELLTVTKEFRRLIQSQAPASTMHRCARGEGMITLVQDGIAKALEGRIDYRTVRAIAS